MVTVGKEDVLNVLPQTQCEECGYKGCEPYANAILEGEDIDLCAPGGVPVMRELETLLVRKGSKEKVLSRYTPPTTAEIDQDVCIGCTKCLLPCPTDAIIGGKKQNHFVLASDCTGCGLCVPICPVDCIELISDPVSCDTQLKMKEGYRALYENKKNRIQTPRSVNRPLDIRADLKKILEDKDEQS